LQTPREAPISLRDVLFSFFLSYVSDVVRNDARPPLVSCPPRSMRLQLAEQGFVQREQGTEADKESFMYRITEAGG
jgi:hypothetical protein